MIIVRKGDRIPVEIGDAVFYFEPVLMQDKMEIIATLPQREEDRKTSDLLDFTKRVIAKTLKAVSGLKNADETLYELEFENGLVSDSCVNELMNCDFGTAIAIVSGMILKGVPSEGKVLDPRTGVPLEGVLVKKALPAKK